MDTQYDGANITKYFVILMCTYLCRGGYFLLPNRESSSRGFTTAQTFLQ
jgi:hypothetical protein